MAININDSSRNITYLKSVDVPKYMLKTDAYVRHTAIGFSQDDLLTISNKYTASYDAQLRQNGGIIGLCGACVVEKVGSGVRNLETGQRMAYGFGSIGSCSTYRRIESHYLTPIPDDINDLQVAACFRSALWAHNLLFRVVAIREKYSIMVHNPLGSIESILCNWASSLGITVIAVVKSEDEFAAAQIIDCKLMVLWNDPSAEEKIKEITNGIGVNVVYNSIGQSGHDFSLKYIKYFGAYVCYGSGVSAMNIKIEDIYLKSIFFTIPTLEQYKSNSVELNHSGAAVFRAMKKGIIATNLQTLPMSQIPSAAKSVNGVVNPIVIVPQLR